MLESTAQPLTFADGREAVHALVLKMASFAALLCDVVK